MAEDYYNDSPSPAPSSDPAVEAKEEKSGDSNVALLPKSFFPAGKDLEPGSECKVRVDSVQEDQVVVTYVHDSDTEEVEEEVVSTPPVDAEMAGFMA